jgi:hypothetical protein
MVVAALLIFATFSALVLPGQAARSDPQTGYIGVPDLSVVYSAGTLYRWAEAYGEDGREEYIRARFTFDLVWPLVYGCFLVTAITWLYSKAFPAGSIWRLANTAPLAGMLFDYLENMSTSLVMARFPAQTPLFDWLAGFFTLSKWVFIALSFVLLVTGMIAATRKWIANKSTSPRQ